jgi:chromate reductase
MKVLGISGSLRQDSYNSLLLERARQELPVDASLEIWNGLRALPHYDEDLDTIDDPHKAVAQLRDAIAGADAVLFVTPEYNGSIPGVLKNAIDWASRPKGEAALKGKPVAAIGASTGQFGGVWAQADLRRVLGIAGARVVDMEFAVPKVHEAHASDAGIINAQAQPELEKVLEELVEQARINAALAAKKEAEQVVLPKAA